MLTFILVALVLILVAIVVVTRRTARREPRPEAYEGHRASDADRHWSGGAHSGQSYGGGAGEAGPGSRGGAL